MGLSSALNAAAVVDLATDTNMDGTPDNTQVTLDGVEFEWGANPGGTGNLQPIVQIQKNGEQKGYNTSGRPLQFDEKTAANFTRDAQIGAVPVVDSGGTNFYEFLFDLNESNNSGSLLSIDTIQIYTSPTPGKNDSDVSMLGTLRYNLDNGMDNRIELDHDLSPGSGTTDMIMRVPVSFFNGVPATDYFYLYSEMGLTAGYEATSGAEQWAFFGDSVAIPEPSAFLFLGSLATLGAFGRWRKRHSS